MIGIHHGDTETQRIRKNKNLTTIYKGIVSAS